MKTLILKINPTNIDNLKIKKSAELLRKNKLVVFPTETVYGLGANALNESAVNNIFIAKGRPNDNPLIVHIGYKKDLNKLVKDIPDTAKVLIKTFWPGPLTLIFEKSSIVPNSVTAGLNTVAIRMPKNKIALKLIKTAKVPVAAPSANLSGKPSPTKVEHVIDDLYGKVDLIIDGGNVSIGLESTVLDLTSKIPTILRPGKITKEELERIIGKVNTKAKDGKIAKSPGMKHKHYSPNAKVILFSKKELENLKKKYKDKKVGIILNNKSLESFAKNIFSKFREMDKKGIEIILVEKVPKQGLGLAIMNRLDKAKENK